MDFDLEYWMTNLSDDLKQIPITQLAIPGTHDSMTYCITHNSPIAPDFDISLLKCSCFGSLFGYVISKWAKTQDYTPTNQLKSGIRYFDLRVATRDGTKEFYFVHGLYAAQVSDVLRELYEYLKDHPNEVVIIDFNHFYAFTSQDHDNLMDLIKNTFSSYLVPVKRDMDELTLEYLTIKNTYQVLCIYRSDKVYSGYSYLWPAPYFPTPWPNTLNTKTLIETITNNLQKRNAKIGYITQFLLTPDTSFVVKHLLSSLKNTCADPLINLQCQWLSEQRAGKGGVNIVITDFMNLSSCQFVKEVITLNYKLLP